jgi:hypothetical protein
MTTIPTINVNELEVEVPATSAKFVRVQPAGPREFVVSGPKADAVRKLIFAELGLTRKQIALVADCSVSRVGEVVWGLQHDGVEFPAIPLRETKVEEDEEQDARALPVGS